MEEPKDIFSFITSEKIEVPNESYFAEIANKVISTKKSEVKIIPFHRKPFFKWAVAASIILPLAIYFISQGTTESPQKQEVLLGLNDIPTNDIQQYIMDNMEEFNLSEVSEMVSTETLETFNVEQVTLETKTESGFFDGITTEEIESYFDIQEIDEEELEDEGIFI